MISQILKKWQRFLGIQNGSACTIATFLIHYKIDYCKSLPLNLPATQTNRLQLVHRRFIHANFYFI